ncbi:MAG TPA: ATP-binding protein [Syntrophorhabdales bacterium]|nr:ATP-binding protein [Syntrophorhabdales bacterium]
MKITTSILESIIDSLSAGIWIVNSRLEIEWINTRGFRCLCREELAALEDKRCFRKIFGMREVCEDCPVLKTFESGRTERLDIKLEYEGQAKHFVLTATPLQRKGQKSFTHVIEMIQDVTMHQKIGEELRRLNELQTAIIDNAPVAIFTIDKKGVFTSVNPALAIISDLGFRTHEKLIGFNWLQNPYTIKCGLAARIRQGLQGVAFQLDDFPFVTYRGRSQYLNFKGVPLLDKKGEVESLLCIIEETTDRVRTKVQLIQEARMSAIGRLATGVAHELSNPLATITAHSELAHELLQRTDGLPLEAQDLQDLSEYLEVIQEQAFRCKKTIKNLLDLNRRNGFETGPIDLHRLFVDLVELINFKKMKIRMVSDLAKDIPRVKGDLYALRQTFLNVLNNAIDAVEEKHDAQISIKGFMEGPSVRVEIEDNGEGIPASIVDLVFEPFFTTKGSQKGTGLGLTLCYEFLSKMGGTIEISNRAGGGSVCRITLCPWIEDEKVERKG